MSSSDSSTADLAAEVMTACLIGDGRVSCHGLRTHQSRRHMVAVQDHGVRRRINVSCRCSATGDQQQITGGAQTGLSAETVGGDDAAGQCPANRLDAAEGVGHPAVTWARRSQRRRGIRNYGGLAGLFTRVSGSVGE